MAPLGDTQGYRIVYAHGSRSELAGKMQRVATVDDDEE